MKITDAFLGEHGVLYPLLDATEAGTATADLTELRRAAAFLEAALASHAAAEDQLLFAMLDPHLGPMGPLAVMRHEHEQIEVGLATAREAEDADAARRALELTVATARAHFAKEEQVLFPMAERVLAPDVLEELGARWAARRGVVLAGGVAPCR